MTREPYRFTIDVQVRDNLTLVTLGGDLVHATALSLADRLAPLLTPVPAKVVVDLAAVHLLDPAGLGALAHLAHLLRAHHRPLHLACLREQAWQLTVSTGLAAAFTIHDNLAAAVAPEQPTGGRHGEMARRAPKRTASPQPCRDRP